MSIILNTLLEATPASVQSAIIMIDGTALFSNTEYQAAKKQYKEDGNIPSFIMVVRPLFEQLWAETFQGE